MHSSFLKPIFLVTESSIDAQIIRSLLNPNERPVYMVVAGGYSNIASIVRTQYLMYNDDYNYIVVFDSGSEDPEERSEKIEMVKQLSGAYFHPNNIGVFCFHNTLDKELGIENLRPKGVSDLRKYLEDNKERLKNVSTIKDIQLFIDGLIDS